MKRVAIPIVNNNLSEYFGECNFYEIFEIEKNGFRKKTAQIPNEITISELPEWLREQGVTDVIVYKVSKDIISRFAAKKVNLFVGVPIDKPEKLIQDYLTGQLESDKKIIAEITNK